jgi:hypothetical protein
LKKYLAAAALAQVTVLVNVIDQVAPDVEAVLELVPDQPVNCEPTATALLRLVVTLVISVLTAASMEIKLPAVGADLAVSVVLV